MQFELSKKETNITRLTFTNLITDQKKKKQEGNFLLLSHSFGSLSVYHWFP